MKKRGKEKIKEFNEGRKKNTERERNILDVKYLKNIYRKRAGRKKKHTKTEHGDAFRITHKDTLSHVHLYAHTYLGFCVGGGLSM